MISPTLETKLNTLVAGLADQLPTVQEAFRAVYGRYWQGLRTHTAIPADGATAAPNLDAKPTDQEETWATFGFALPAQMECALSVNVYQSRKGHGYVINADVIVDGVHYRRAANFGPELWREHNWQPFKQTRL